MYDQCALARSSASFNFVLFNHSSNRRITRGSSATRARVCVRRKVSSFAVVTSMRGLSRPLGSLCNCIVFVSWFERCFFFLAYENSLCSFKIIPVSPAAIFQRVCGRLRFSVLNFVAEGRTFERFPQAAFCSGWLLQLFEFTGNQNRSLKFLSFCFQRYCGFQNATRFWFLAL